MNNKTKNTIKTKLYIGAAILACITVTIATTTSIFATSDTTQPYLTAATYVTNDDNTETITATFSEPVWFDAAGTHDNDLISEEFTCATGDRSGETGGFEVRRRRTELAINSVSLPTTKEEASDTVTITAASFGTSSPRLEYYPFTNQVAYCSSGDFNLLEEADFQIRDVAENMARGKTVSIRRAATEVTTTTDTTAPRLTETPTLVTSNTNSAYAKIGDILTLTFTVSETLKRVPRVRIAGGEARVFAKTGNTYTAIYMVTTDTSNGAVTYDIGVLTDMAENTFDPALVTFAITLDTTQPSLTAATYVTNGDTTTITATFSEPVWFDAAGTHDNDLISEEFTCATGDRSGETGGFQLKDGNRRLAINSVSLQTAAVEASDTVTITSAATNFENIKTVNLIGYHIFIDQTFYCSGTLSSLHYADFQIRDVVGNKVRSGRNSVQITRKTATEVTADNTAPYLTETPTLATSNTNSAYAKEGDRLTLTFTTSETLSQTPTVQIAGNNAEVTPNGNTYTATYTVTTDTSNRAVTYDIGEISDGTNTVNPDPVTSTVIVDTTPPVITLNGDNLLILTVGDTYTEKGATATEEATVTEEGTVDTNTAGDYTITYTATDEAGNIGTATRTVRVQVPRDTTPPVITLNGDNLLILTVGDTYTEKGATATEEATVTEEGTVDTNTAGDYTITYTATDEAGNIGTATRTVSVQVPRDTTPPVITLNGDNLLILTVGDTYTEKGATATEEATVTEEGTVDTNTAGDYTITYTATDAAGNIGTATRTVRVQVPRDTTPPVITLNGDNLLILTVGDTYTEKGATATEEATVTEEGTVDTNTAGDYTITYTATDEAGNIGTATRTVSVQVPRDTTPPVITLNGDNLLILTVGDTYTEKGATATEEATVTEEGTVDTNTAGDYTITYTATDEAGNIGTATRTVRVQVPRDTTPPVITLNGDNLLILTVGDTYTEKGATATEEATVTEEGTVDTNTAGDYTITYTATDEAGNIGTATRTVRVQVPRDTTPPVITLNGDNLLILTVGDTYTEKGATATEEATVTEEGTVDTNTAGDYTITYTATDEAGNIGTATRTVRVQVPRDTTPPVITLNGDNLLILTVGDTYTEKGATATEEATVTEEGTVDTNTAGDYTITYTATDEAGNIGTATRTVRVQVPRDTTAPVNSKETTSKKSSRGRRSRGGGGGGGGVVHVQSVPAAGAPQIGAQQQQQEQVTTVTAPTVTAPTVPTFISTLQTITGTYRKGDASEDVRSIQKLLNQTNCPVAKTGVGSKGKETAYFGVLTETAVRCYQTEKNLEITGTVTPELYALLIEDYTAILTAFVIYLTQLISDIIAKETAVIQ